MVSSFHHFFLRLLCVPWLVSDAAGAARPWHITRHIAFATFPRWCYDDRRQHYRAFGVVVEQRRWMPPHTSPTSLPQQQQHLFFSNRGDVHDDDTEHSGGDKPDDSNDEMVEFLRVSKGEEDDDDSSVVETAIVDDMDVLRQDFVSAAPLAIAFVAFWPLLTVLRLWFSHQVDWDLDSYLLLRDMMDDTTTTAATTLYDEAPSQIMELPPLSPAERLVDALFGPNTVDRRVF